MLNNNNICTVYFTGTNPQTSVKGSLTDDQKTCKVPRLSQAKNIIGFQWGKDYQSENFFTIGPESTSPERVVKTPENTCFSPVYPINPMDRVNRGPFSPGGILDKDPNSFFNCIKLSK